MAALLASWWEGEEAEERRTATDPLAGLLDSDPHGHDWRRAGEIASVSGSSESPQRIGMLLRAIVGKPIEGWRVDAERDTHAKAWRYRLRAERSGGRRAR
jgi:hypothetical protein